MSDHNVRLDDDTHKALVRKRNELVATKRLVGSGAHVPSLAAAIDYLIMRHDEANPIIKEGAE